MTAIWIAIVLLTITVIVLTLWLTNLNNKVSRLTWGGDGNIPGGE